MTNPDSKTPQACKSWRVSWSAEDGEWVGTCDSYPSLSWLDPDPLRAMEGILGLVYAEDLDREAVADIGAGWTVVYMDDESFPASLDKYEQLAKSESAEDRQAARAAAERSIRRGMEQVGRGDTVRRDDLLDEG